MVGCWRPVVLMMAHYLGDTVLTKRVVFPLVLPFPDSFLEIHVRTSVLSIFHNSVYIELDVRYTPTTFFFLDIEKQHLDRSILVPLRRARPSLSLSILRST